MSSPLVVLLSVSVRAVPGGSGSWSRSECLPRRVSVVVLRSVISGVVCLDGTSGFPRASRRLWCRFFFLRLFTLECRLSVLHVCRFFFNLVRVAVGTVVSLSLSALLSSLLRVMAAGWGGWPRGKNGSVVCVRESVYPLEWSANRCFSSADAPNRAFFRVVGPIVIVLRRFCRLCCVVVRDSVCELSLGVSASPSRVSSCNKLACCRACITCAASCLTSAMDRSSSQPLP